MAGAGELGVPPTHAELRQRINSLINGNATREDVADWAARWVRLPNPQIDDAEAWQAIQRLAGADLRASREEYLHSGEDFHAWLLDLGEP